MFDVGFTELVLLFVIGLLVLGPERLPKVASEIGRWVARARRTATQLRRQLEREIELAEVIQPPKPSPRPTPAPTPTAQEAPHEPPSEQTAAEPTAPDDLAAAINPSTPSQAPKSADPPPQG